MKRVWIALVHLAPEHGCTLIRENSFAQAVAFVTDAKEFTAQLSAAAKQQKMAVVGIEDLEPFEKRLRSHIVAGELKEKAQEAEKTGRFSFGMFYAYRAE